MTGLGLGAGGQQGLKERLNRFLGHGRDLYLDELRLLQKLLKGALPETEPVVLVEIARLLEIVLGELEDEQLAAGP